jgi:prevent-host-death family protein
MKTLSVGQLRQNPTDALNSVADGETVIVTKHNRPIADLVPHRRLGVSGLEAMARLRVLEVDPGWLEDLRTARSVGDRDYWA